MRNFHSTFTRAPYAITPVEKAPQADPTDPDAVAQELMDSEPYQVYLHMDQFSYQDVFAMALEEAAAQIAERAALREAVSFMATAPLVDYAGDISLLSWH